MGFLKKFIRNVFRDGVPTHTTSSFERLSDEELEAHLGVVRYGDFVLTGAVRPRTTCRSCRARDIATTSTATKKTRPPCPS